MKSATTFHDVRRRERRGVLIEVEEWRAAGGRLYERRQEPGEPTVVRVAAGEAGFEMAANKVRKLRPAEITAWRREVRMVPENFLAHQEEMGVLTTAEGVVERLEAPRERLILERDSRSGIPLKITDLRSKQTIAFEQPRDVQGRHWPRLEIHRSLERELWRDRILHVEFDVPVPEEVRRLWDALERGVAL